MPVSNKLVRKIRACTLCQPDLAHGVRPVLQFAPEARLLIAGQAPGRKVHESGIPFDDASGDRLREWMGIDKDTFYDRKQIAILPMSFCYPGSGKSGDLPPRSECAPAWREPLLQQLSNVELILILGKYAQDYHLGKSRLSLTERVKAWRRDWPTKVPLPHPSPRNNIWLSKNPWFAKQLLPALRMRIAEILGR